jgi:hypothetical protein
MLGSAQAFHAFNPRMLRSWVLEDGAKYFRFEENISSPTSLFRYSL